VTYSITHSSRPTVTVDLDVGHGIVDRRAERHRFPPAFDRIERPAPISQQPGDSYVARDPEFRQFVLVSAMPLLWRGRMAVRGSFGVTWLLRRGCPGRAQGAAFPAGRSQALLDHRWHDQRAVSGFALRTHRVVTLALVLVVLTTAIAPAVALAAGSALTAQKVGPAPGAPVPGTTCSRPQATALTVDSDLRLPSNISAWAIDRFLALATPLPPLGAAFKLAEARYQVNALYLLAHAMLESGFGRSYIAQNFNNLFGWTAYDRDPVLYATRFPSFAASIDYVAMRISDSYLDPDGIHYGGAPTLRGMYRYATDPLWESKIAQIANSICVGTLADRGLELTSSLAGTELKPGETTELTITSSPEAALPDGLRLAARAQPTAEAASGATGGPDADATDLATYSLTPAFSEGGAFTLPVEAGALPGDYTLEFILLDSDGGILPATDRLPIPPVRLSVVARHAATYAVNQTSVGLFVSIENVGPEPIASGGEAAAELEVIYQPTGGLGEAGATAPAAPRVIASIELVESLEPGESRGFQLPPDVRLEIPGTLFVRLTGAGDDGAPLDLPTAAFRLTYDNRSVGAGASGSAGEQVLLITPLDGALPSAGDGTAANEASAP
jgi:hypothetical protein